MLKVLVLLLALAGSAPVLAQTEPYANRAGALKGPAATEPARRADRTEGQKA